MSLHVPVPLLVIIFHLSTNQPAQPVHLGGPGLEQRQADRRMVEARGGRKPYKSAISRGRRRQRRQRMHCLVWNKNRKFANLLSGSVSPLK